MTREDFQLRKDLDELFAELGFAKEQLQRLDNDDPPDWFDEMEFYLKGEVDDKFIQVPTEASVDAKINNIYRDLNRVLDNYDSTIDRKYSLFRGDCWTINNNFESSASITSGENTSENDDYPSGHVDNFTVTGTFRTKDDLVGIYWNAEDLITHPYISYGKVSDYRNVVLEFDYHMTGCRNWKDNYSQTSNPSVLTLNMADGSIYYVVLYQFISGNHVEINFSNLMLHNGNVYIDSQGQPVEVHEDTPVPVNNIASIMLALTPNVTGNGSYEITSNIDFTCEVYNIEVANGEIGYEKTRLNTHLYRLCEGYDDFYNLNPFRVCREMRKLGYVGWVDLYIGASHFYEKSGTVGDTIDTSSFDHTRTEKMTLNPNVPLNKAFEAWLDCYSRELKANDVDRLIISVSMENLQPPISWRQRTSVGDYGVTNWVPSTFFYSPCNDNVINYMQSVSKACLDIIIENDMPPILQMGEAWWWWNEYDIPKDPETHKPICSKCYQAPCFYDTATKNRYYSEFGNNMPEYESSWEDPYDHELMAWLNQQLCEYSEKLREVAKSYEDGTYMALFFPPSVMDTDRVPPMIQEADYIKDAYSPEKLDVLQLEDYDWVIEKNPHHEEVYSIGQELGFDVDDLHYYGGFVQYPEDAEEFWKLIEDSMVEAINRHFGEIFVWAGTQVRRDNKYIGREDYSFVENLIKLLRGD